jgi:hypothetical protein
MYYIVTRCATTAEGRSFGPGAGALQSPLTTDRLIRRSMIAMWRQATPIAEPVTNQVTTNPGNSRQNATVPGGATPLACDNPTGRDFAGRNGHAW